MSDFETQFMAIQYDYMALMTTYMIEFCKHGFDSVLILDADRVSIR